MAEKTKLEPLKDSISTIRLADGEIVNQPPPRQVTHTIVKIQIPLMQNLMGDTPRALMYNESRKVMMEVMLTNALRARFKKDEVKAFFHVEVSSYNIEIGDRAPWQKW